MATRRIDEGTYEDRGYDRETRRWREQDERWPRSGEVGEHDRPWHQPEETWPSRRGMYGMGGAARAYNAGGYGRGTYERGYEMRSYDALADFSEPWFGPDREGYADEGNLRAGWEIPPRRRGKPPKGYTRSDERIREDVCERLMETPLDASDVEVEVKDGEVTLTGTVRARHEKRIIEDIAADVRGVHDVHNRVRLSDQPPAGSEAQERALHS